MSDIAVQRTILESLDHRIEGLREELSPRAPQLETESRHLDLGTVERDYYHWGYLCALRDVRKLLGGDGGVN